MKVFISWSGALSEQVARILYEWLPSVLQTVSPYISSEDIDKGSRWSIELARELETSSYGIICVTPDNMAAPWLNFEVGALSKAFDASRVSPFLLKVRPSELTGPLTQFQATSHDRQDVLRLLEGINESCGEVALDANRLNRVFEVWWPNLDERLSALNVSPTQKQSVEKGRGANEVLEEVLELVRGQQRLLSTPDTLLPPDYLRSALLRGDGSKGSKRGTWTFHGGSEFNKVLAARISFANASLMALTSGYGFLRVWNQDPLSEWANAHPNRAARRLISPFENSWDGIYPLAKKIRKNYDLRVLSDEEARRIGNFGFVLIDGEEVAVTAPGLSGGFMTDDRQLVDHLNGSFQVMWSTSVEFHHFVTANWELFATYPEEIPEVDIDTYPDGFLAVDPVSEQV